METTLLIVNAALGCAILGFLFVRSRGDGAAPGAAAEAAANAAQAEATREALRQAESRLTEALSRGERATREGLAAQLATAREEHARASAYMHTAAHARAHTRT